MDIITKTQLLFGHVSTLRERVVDFEYQLARLVCRAPEYSEGSEQLHSAIHEISGLLTQVERETLEIAHDLEQERKCGRQVPNRSLLERAAKLSMAFQAAKTLFEAVHSLLKHLNMVH